jgi:hypothetical protein
MSNIRVRRRAGRELPDLEVVWLDDDDQLVDLRTYVSFRLVASTRSDGAGTVVLNKTLGFTAQNTTVVDFSLLITFALHELDAMLAGAAYKCQLDAFDAAGKDRGFEEFDWTPLPSIVAVP